MYLFEHTHTFPEREFSNPPPHASESRVDVHNDPKALLNHQRSYYVEPHFSEIHFILLAENLSYPHGISGIRMIDQQGPLVCLFLFCPHLHHLWSFSSPIIFSRSNVLSKVIMERRKEEGYFIFLSQKIPQSFRVNQTHVLDLNYRKRLFK